MSVQMTCNRIRAWLKSKWQVKVPDDWLSACIEWIHSENEGLPVEHSDLNQMVYEQWLVSDLCELGTPSLPEDLNGQPKVNLSGKYCLQINSLVDISTPYYGQLKKLRGQENENVSVTAATQLSQPVWEAKPSRVLMMTMTDGVQEVQGMEYRSIPSINAKLTPGTKVLVHGDVICRHGVLLLKPENLTLLGGEVEAMFNENAPDHALQSALDRNRTMDQQQTARKEFPTCPKSTNHPQPVFQKRQNHPPPNQLPHRAEEQQYLSHANRKPVIQMTNQSLPRCDEWDDDDIDLFANLDDAELSGDPKWERPSDADMQNMMEGDLDDDILASQEMLIPEHERTNHITAPQQYRPSKQPPSHFNQQSSNDTIAGRASLSTVESERPCSSKQSRETPAETIAPTQKVQGQQSYQSSPSTVFDTFARNIPKHENLDLTSQPFTYLINVQNSWPPSEVKNVTIKAYVATLLDKLEYNNGQHWSLRAKINDGSAVMDVILSDQILTSLIGFTANECMQLRVSAKHDKEARQKITTGISSCQESLINMSAILEIKLDPSQPAPVVMHHRSLNMEEFVALHDRNKNS